MGLQSGPDDCRRKWKYVAVLLALAVSGYGLQRSNKSLKGYLSPIPTFAQSPLIHNTNTSTLHRSSENASLVSTPPSTQKRNNEHTDTNKMSMTMLESRIRSLNAEKLAQHEMGGIPGMSSWQQHTGTRKGEHKEKLLSIDMQIHALEQQLLSLRLSDGRLINDPTLPWNTTMYRPWLDPDLSLSDQPPAMILLTTFGWNSPNISEGLKYPRHIYETQLHSALVNHPWFHPTAWDEIESGKLAIRRHGFRYYVFVDLNTKDFPNYPVYGGQLVNFDALFNRTVARQRPPVDDCGIEDRSGTTKSRLFRELLMMKARLAVEIPTTNATTKNATTNATTNATADTTTNVTTQIGEAPSTALLFLLSTGGRAWRNPKYKTNSRKNPVIHKYLSCAKIAKNSPVAIAAMDASFGSINEEIGDQGMLPPPIKVATLDAKEENDIQTCAAESKRKFHASYVGNFRSNGFGSRSAYKDFHDNNRTVVLRYFNADEMKNSILANISYEEMLRETEFALAPRGDNKFSFRFSEVLSAGTIPVVHADDWVWPFRPEVVDWNRCAVIFPEKDAGRLTMDFIANMTAEERCRRRNYCYFHIYKKYVQTPKHHLQGYIDGLEAVANSNGTASFAGVRCNTTSIQSRECNPN